MTVLASIEANVVFMVIAGIVGVIKWMTKKDETPITKPPPAARAKAPAVRPSDDPEEVRMRRFLEALGVPADQRPPPPVKRREPPAGQAVLPKIQPRGPIVARDIAPSYTKKLQTPATLVVPPRPKSPLAAELPVMQTKADNIRLRELETPLVREFQTASSQVTAIPFEASHADMRDAYKTASEQPSEQPPDSIRELLRSPRGLRNLVLLREILGPPRALQTGGSLPAFP